jgi:hypothetical protein
MIWRTLIDLLDLVELVDLGAVDHHNAGLLRVGGIDEHFSWHVIP